MSVRGVLEIEAGGAQGHRRATGRACGKNVRPRIN